MHFMTLTAVEIPKINEYEENACMEAEVINHEQNRQISCRGEQDHEEAGIQDKFYCMVHDAVAEKMQKYYEGDTDPKRMRFCDWTERIVEGYEGTVDCLKLPQGTIVPDFESPYGNRFVIRDGKVFEADAGPVHQLRRTKRAKRIRALTGYPLKKLYPDIYRFAVEWFGIEYIEKESAFGYYTNPNGIWDWYEIGGRWPYLLLVKDTCREYFSGQISWTWRDETVEPPRGYRWTSGARMRDIEWQAMWAWHRARLEERFGELEDFFRTGERPKNIYGKRIEDGIWDGNSYLYHRGESLEDYLKREDWLHESRYPLCPHDLLDKKGGWHASDDRLSEPEEKEDCKEPWNARVEEFLDSLVDDDVLVIVDYHR